VADFFFAEAGDQMALVPWVLLAGTFAARHRWISRPTGTGRRYQSRP
jgi:hypothetical protein